MFSYSSIGSVAAYPFYKALTSEKQTAQKLSLQKSSSLQRDISYFRAKAQTISSPDEFLKDQRLMKFALTAYGMESQLAYPYRIKVILKDNPADSKAIVNKMTDASYKQINAAFDFYGSGVKNLKDPSFLDGLVTKYVNSCYEQNLNKINPAIGDALYFERKITSIKGAYQLISDPVLFAVAKKSLNIPDSIVTSGTVEKLKAKIEKAFDFSKVNDPAYIKKITNRYLVLKDTDAQNSSSNSLLDLFA